MEVNYPENLEFNTNENLLDVSERDSDPYWKLNYGSPDKKSESQLIVVTNTQGRTTQYIRQVYVKKNCKYQLSLEVSCTDYNCGKLGVGIGGSSNSLSVSEKTEGFLLLEKTITFKENMGINFFVGGMNQAKLSGIIRNISLVQIPSTINSKKKTISTRKDVICDFEAERVFIEEMNRKSHFLGMKNTFFKNPHGLVASGQFTTTADMMRLGLYATGLPEIIKVWGAKEYLVNFEGTYKRTVNISTTIVSPYLESHYTVLGGKTGTLAPGVFNAIMLLSDDDENIFLATIMHSETNENRFIDIKKLIDISRKRMVDYDTFPLETFSGHSGSVLQIRSNPLYWTNTRHKLIYSFNEHEKKSQASLTKIMTALIMLENIQSLNERFKIKLSDIVGGSGPILFEGDEISFRDALFLMLLPSSNSVAKAISRVIGHRLITTHNK